MKKRGKKKYARRKQRSKKRSLLSFLRFSAFLKEKARILFFIVLVLSLSAGFYIPSLRAGAYAFYPSACLGDWQNTEKAQGKPDVENPSDASLFYQENSAVMNQDSGSQILCGGFDGEWPEEGEVTNASLHIVLAASFIQQAVLQSDTVVQDPADEAVPTEGKAPALKEETTDTFSVVSPAADAFEAPKAIIIEQEPPSDFFAGNDFLQVSYSFGGSVWQHVANIQDASSQDFSFFLPGIATLQDVRKMQVRLQGLPTVNGTPTVYVDGMWLEVDIEEHIFDSAELPKIRLKNADSFISGQGNFQTKENPTFIIHDPQFDLKAIQELVQEEKAEVLEDRLGKLGTPKTPRQLSEGVISQEVRDLFASDESPLVASIVSAFQSVLHGISVQEEPQAVESSEVQEPSDEAQENTGEESPTEPVLQEQEETAQEDLVGESSRDVAEQEKFPEEQAVQVQEEKEETELEAAQEPEEAVQEPEVQPQEETVEEEIQEEVPDEPQEEAVEEEIQEENQIQESVQEAVEEIVSFLFPKYAYAQDGAMKSVQGKVLDPSGQATDIEVQVFKFFQDGQQKFEVNVEKPEREFRPGVYTLELEIETKEAILIAQQDFAWGVLAVNFDKSIYLPQEEAYVQMGVLNNEGHTICNAALDVYITNPQGVVKELSTKNGTVQYSGKCRGDSFTNTPDYFAYYEIGQEIGLYKVDLVALTPNGEKSVTDSFEVRPSVLVDVKRAGATRIYPPEIYMMSLTFTPAEEFVGKVVEHVPASFELQGIEQGYVAQSGSAKEIVWNVEWKAGQEYKLTYMFDAPDISPEFYLLGPAQLYQEAFPNVYVEEMRSWQLASDITFSDGFETGDITAWSGSLVEAGNTLEVITGAKKTGSYGLHVVGVGGTVDDAWVRHALSSSSSTLYQRVQMKLIINVPSGNHEQIVTTNTLTDGGGMISAIGARATPDANSLYTLGAASWVDTLFNFSLDTWYCVELYTSISATAGVVQAWVDGVEKANRTGLNTGTSNISQEYIGMNGPTIAGEYYFDDYSSDTAAQVGCPAGITVSGNYYQLDTTTASTPCDGSTANVALRVNGGAESTTTCADANGAFSFTGVSANAGDTITIYSKSANKGNMALVAGSADVTDLALYENAVVARDEDNGTLSILDMVDWDNDNDATNMLFTAADASPDTLVVEDGVELHIYTGDTFQPGGTVTTSPSSDAATADGDIHIDGTGTLNVETNALSVGGDFNNEGTFTKSSGQTTTFTATATSHTITDGGENLDTAVFNGSGGGWSFADATIIDVDLTMTAGTLSGTNNITVNGGDVTGDGAISLTGGTFLVDGTGTFGGATGWTFSSLTLGDGAGVTTSTASGAGSITVSSALTIAASQTLDAASKTWILSGTGTPFVKTGTLTANASTFSYRGAGATNVAAATYYNLDSKPASGSPTHTTASGTVAATNNFIVGDGTNAVTVTATTNDSILDIGADATIAANGTLIASDSAAFTVGGSWSNSGTFTNSNGTVTFDSTATGKTLGGTLTGSSGQFYDLVFSGSGGEWTLNAAVAVADDLTMTNGNVVGTNTVTVNGNVAGTSGTLALTGGTFEQRVNGTTKNFGTTSGSSVWSFSSLTFSNSHASTGAVIDVQTGGTGGITVTGTLLVSKTGDAAGTTLQAGNRTYTLSNSNGSKPFNLDQASGALTAETSTFSFTGDNDSGDVTLEDATYYNLTLGGATADNYALSAATTASNDLTINANATLTGTSNMTVNGSATGAGTVNLTGGTFEQQVSAAENFGTTSGSTTWTLNNLKFNNSDASASRTITTSSTGTGTVVVSGTLTIGDSGTQVAVLDNNTNDRIFDLDSALTIGTQGTLQASSSASFTIAGNFTNNGTFTHNSGTVTIDGSGTSTFTGSADPAITFYNLTSTTAGKTLAFTASKTFRINGKITIQGASGNQINLHSSLNTTQWTINHQGTESIQYANIQDAACASGTTNISLDNTSTDGDSNNGTCWLFPALTFTLDASSVTLDLESSSWTDTATSVLSVTTKAGSGYEVRAYQTDSLRHITYTTTTIADWSGTNATPTTFTDANCVDNSLRCGWGYTTNDADLTQFSSSKYAGFTQTAPGDIVASSTTAKTSADATTITYRASVGAVQAAGTYRTTIVYIVTPQF